MTTADRKRDMRTRKKERNKKHWVVVAKLRKIHRSCFWTRPLGHRYNVVGVCAGCGRIQYWSVSPEKGDTFESVKYAKKLGLWSEA